MMNSALIWELARARQKELLAEANYQALARTVRTGRSSRSYRGGWAGRWARWVSSLRWIGSRREPLPTTRGANVDPLTRSMDGAADEPPGVALTCADENC